MTKLIQLQLLIIYTLIVVSISILMLLSEDLNIFNWYYFLLINLLIFSSIYIKSLLRLIPMFLLVYLGISLMNISNWRGVISPETMYLYLICSLLLLLPLILFTRRNYAFSSHIQYLNFFERPLFFYVMISHLALVYLALAFIYLKVGPVILSQSLRFQIPTSLEYVIKSSIPLVVFLPFFKLTPKKMYGLLALLVLPTLMIGSRGVVLIGLFSFFIVLYSVGSLKIKLDRKKIVYALILAVGVIYLGFYLRRMGGDLLSPSELLRIYFFYDSPLILLILPLYLSLRETVGLTSMIIDKSMFNNINENPLFYADLYTVLPGVQKAAGQSLGDIIGRVESGGLTPGLLGGVYIDYGSFTTMIYFLSFGLIFAFLYNYSKRNITFFPVFVMVLTQFFHLFHRGFLKPEYVTTIFIAFVYYILMKKIRY